MRHACGQHTSAYSQGKKNGVALRKLRETSTDLACACVTHAVSIREHTSGKKKAFKPLKKKNCLQALGGPFAHPHYAWCLDASEK
jgi:hypothetical protein